MYILCKRVKIGSVRKRHLSLVSIYTYILYTLHHTHSIMNLFIDATAEYIIIPVSVCNDVMFVGSPFILNRNIWKNRVDIVAVYNDNNNKSDCSHPEVENNIML